MSTYLDKYSNQAVNGHLLIQPSHRHIHDVIVDSHKIPQVDPITNRYNANRGLGHVTSSSKKHLPQSNFHSASDHVLPVRPRKPDIVLERPPLSDGLKSLGPSIIQANTPYWSNINDVYPDGYPASQFKSFGPGMIAQDTVLKRQKSIR